MKILVTGGTGFIGSYLAKALIEKGHNVSTGSRNDSAILKFLREGCNFYCCNLESSEQIKKIVSQLEPDIVYHLAAQNNIPVSWQDPQTTMKINVSGTLILLEALRNSKIEPMIHLVCSSSEYGMVGNDVSLIDENIKFNPSSPYGVSKIAADMLGYCYWKNYGMKITRSRPFAIIGPGKSNDALSQFCKNIIEIESGNKTSLVTGNLRSIRDFLDVRDCVEALIKIAFKGKTGEAYNICSGTRTELTQIVNILSAESQIPVKITQDPKLFRPSDDPVLIGNNSKLKQLDWQPTFNLEKTVIDTLNFWRQHKP
jgi:GDP-4-dehydro-6-deoxy-D-mannose reductase